MDSSGPAPALAPMFQVPEELPRTPPEATVSRFVPVMVTVPVEPEIANALMVTSALTFALAEILMFCAAVLALERVVEE